jgi:signal transduction histidine kinase
MLRRFDLMSKSVLFCIAHDPTLRDQFQQQLQAEYADQYHIETTANWVSALNRLKYLRGMGQRITMLLWDVQAIQSDKDVGDLHHHFPAVSLVLLYPDDDLPPRSPFPTPIAPLSLYTPWRSHDLTNVTNTAIQNYNYRRLAEHQQQMINALQFQNAQLLNTLKESNQTISQSKAQLLQQDKMSVLGQMIAGITHEINNPVGFIAGSLKYAREYLDDLITAIQLYRQHDLSIDPDFNAQIKDLDLDYLIEDFPNLLNAMQEGTDLLRDISTSARIFSRSDQEQKVEFDVHKIIDSALMLLKHRIKATMSSPEITIIRDYEKLPLLRCYPGQLSQVFLNVLVNAVDAFEDANQGKSYDELEIQPNQITIASHYNPETGTIAIAIRDNAGGLDDAIHARIFETLFTTKAVGKGTGLGLSICQRIVETQHHGTLRSMSCWQVGMQFVVELPLGGVDGDFLV